MRPLLSCRGGVGWPVVFEGVRGRRGSWLAPVPAARGLVHKRPPPARGWAFGGAGGAVMPPEQDHVRLARRLTDGFALKVAVF